MPLFGGKKSKKDHTYKESQPHQEPVAQSSPKYENGSHETQNDKDKESGMMASQVPQDRLRFHCQLAHGSPTGVISGFSNVKELYEQIAGCYKLDPQEIMYCTLNTHKVDMNKLLGGQLGLDDFVFAHCRGQPKVVDILKTEDAIGLTITDNGAGVAFIKAIKPNSIVAKIEGIYPGDHIEKVNDQNMIGSRHLEVAKALRAIPQNQMFSLRVVEPLKSGFSEIGGKSSAVSKKGGIGTGRQTLRLRSKGSATVEVPDDVISIAVDKINALMEGFLGITDAELAQTIWEIGNEKKNPSDFASALEDSDLRDFGFTDMFVFDLWGAISDAKQGRLQKTQEFTEDF